MQYKNKSPLKMMLLVLNDKHNDRLSFISYCFALQSLFESFFAQISKAQADTLGNGIFSY